jgi:hypothetical protein
MLKQKIQTMFPSDGADKLVAEPDEETGAWLEQELAGCEFADERLGTRLRKLVRQLSQDIGARIPLACRDWANTKAAYRFLSNRRVRDYEILGGHFQATRERFAATSDVVLILHDTTEFTYSREDVASVGILHKSLIGSKARGRHYTVCGILMHSSLAVTTEGLPLGLVAIKFWTRSKFKGTNALKRKINPTRVPIEQKESVRWLENLKQSTALLDDPQRCVHIGDRESDIYELFYTAEQNSTGFLIRTCVDRLADDGTTTISAAMEQVAVQQFHRLQVRDVEGNMSEAILEVKYHRLCVHPPVGKSKQYGPLMLTVIHAVEQGQPTDRDKIIWKLITNLRIETVEDAVQKLTWYALRWKIETFHKILKSGCKAEESQLRTAERLVNLISIYCILSWRVYWMTMMNRVAPAISPLIAFTSLEVRLLDRLVKDRANAAPGKGSLTKYLSKLARLGGYLGRKRDPPPGNLVVWRGLSRLTDIELGFSLGAQLVGN